MLVKPKRSYYIAINSHHRFHKHPNAVAESINVIINEEAKLQLIKINKEYATINFGLTKHITTGYKRKGEPNFYNRLSSLAVLHASNEFCTISFSNMF